MADAQDNLDTPYDAETPAPEVTPEAAPAPEVTSDATPAPSAPQAGSSEWAVGNSYSVGDHCSYGGQGYQCRQAHRVDAPNWTPPNTPALWQPAEFQAVPPWQLGKTYDVGELCSFDGQNYSCRQGHRADAPNWTPPNTQNLWLPQ